ncbi:MAG: hypothetical protein ABWZ52_08900 [Acidimicrobiales bacterium]
MPSHDVFARAMIQTPRGIASLPVQAALLGLALLLLLPIVGRYGSVSVDEGAAALQALRLEAGDGWSYDLPIPSIPSSDVVVPVDKAEPTDNGFAPFARHPLYAVLLAAGLRAGGHVGMVLLSMVGTVLAAAGAANLALQFSTRRVALMSLWVTGLGSPLLFDSFILIAHTLGAAAVAWAILVFLRSDEGHVVRRLGAGAACVLVGVMVRSEILLVAVAVALSWSLAAMRTRRWADAAVAAVTLLAAGGGLLIEDLWRARIGVASVGVGGPSGRARSDPAGFLSERVDAATSSLWSAGDARSGQLIALSGVVLAVLALCIRRGVGQRLWTVLGLLAVVPLIGVFGSGDGELVPQLLVAMPALVVAVVLGVGTVHLDRPAQLIVAVAGFSTALIAATQYAEGGAVEWGGRYFAVLIPLVVPVTLHVLLMCLGERRTRVAMLWPLVVSMCLISAISVQALSGFNDRADRTLAMVSELSVPSELESEPRDARPIIVTSEFGAVRSDWRRYDQHRWVFIGDPEDGAARQDAQVAALAEDLAEPRLVTLVTEHLDRDLARLGPHRIVGRPEAAGPFTVAIVELGDQPT